MTNKIYGAFKKIMKSGGSQIGRIDACDLDLRSPHDYFDDGTFKLASMHITPTLRLLSFRVSKNYVYFSFARPNSDLDEFSELCASDIL